MVEHDPGHLAPERPRRRGRVLAPVAVGLAVLALVLAVLPIGSFIAGLPALAAVAVAIALLATGARRLLPGLVALVSIVALVAAVTVSAGQVATSVSRLTDGAPRIDDPPSPAPSDPFVAPDPDGVAPSGAPFAAGPHRVVYQVLGEGRVRVSYSAFVGSRVGSSTEPSVAVPHTRTQRVLVHAAPSPARFTMIATRGGGTSGPLGCRITVDDRVATERLPAGTDRGIVICTAGPPG